MKIKILRTLSVLILLSICSNLNAQTVFFDSKNIKIDTEDNMIYATEGIAKIPAKNFNNNIANEILSIREKLAKNKMKKSEGKNHFVSSKITKGTISTCWL